MAGGIRRRSTLITTRTTADGKASGLAVVPDATFTSLPPGRQLERAAGTPEQIADLIEDWFREGAADGFNLMPPVLPWMLEVFVAEVVPLLRQRGLFRHGYTGHTLREHYGLPRPDVRFG